MVEEEREEAEAEYTPLPGWVRSFSIAGAVDSAEAPLAAAAAAPGAVEAAVEARGAALAEAQAEAEAPATAGNVER